MTRLSTIVLLIIGIWKSTIAMASVPSFNVTVLTLDGQPVGVNDPPPKLNNDGNVTAGKIFLTGSTIAAVWRGGASGQIVAGTESSQTEVFDISDAGSVVGWGQNYGYAPFGTSQSYAGFVAGADGGITYYPIEAGFIPHAINSAGVIAGFTYAGLRVVGPGVDRTFNAGWGSLHANAINASNQTVGTYDYARDNGIVGMFYDDGAATHTYTSLFGRKQVMGYDVSDSGVVVGTALYTVYQHDDGVATGSDSLGFKMRRPADDANPDVDVLVPLDGYVNSWAYAVNESGWSIGYSEESGSSAGTLWLDDGTPYDLDSLVPNLTSGLHLFRATDVNDLGQIVALATDGSREFPVLLTPTSQSFIPEPAFLSLFALPLLTRRSRQPQLFQ